MEGFIMASSYKVENNVPLPKYAKGKIGSTIDYPIKDLKIGQSFLTEEMYDKKHTNKVRARINLIKARLGIKDKTFSVGPNVDKEGSKLEEEGGQTKVRVWRVR